MAEKKSRILYLKRVLQEQTDEAHPVTVADVLAHLEAGGFAASLKTVAQIILGALKSMMMC